MVRDEAAARYFRNVYPRLRGATRLDSVSRLTRLMTEPGRPERMDWVLGELAGEPAQRVLDVGCGQGGYAVALARRGHRVTAVDLSGAMLDAARCAARAHRVSDRVEFVQADLRDWSPGADYDTVLCIGVVEYYEDPGALVERLYGWSSSRLLLSLTRPHTGPRGVLRSAWLGVHGVRARLLGTHDLERILGALPGSSSSLFATRWTCCASIRRRSLQTAPAPAACGPAAS